VPRLQDKAAILQETFPFSSSPNGIVFAIVNGVGRLFYGLFVSVMVSLNSAFVPRIMLSKRFLSSTAK
jgi:hypothetical protein